MIPKQDAAGTSGVESAQQHAELVRLHARLIELEGMLVRLRGDVAEQVIYHRIALVEKEEMVAALQRREAEIRQALVEKERLLHQIYTSRGFRLLALVWELRQAWRDGPRALAWFLTRLVYRRFPPGVQVRAKALWYRTRQHAKPLPAVARKGFWEPPARQADTNLQPQYGVGVPGLVSVVLPVYNQATFLRDAIRSVLNQSYPAFELIVVNDGSTDAVESVLDEFADHSQVRILVHERNLGLPQALNSGFQYARGEFWTWTSADNLMLPEQLERHVAFLRRHPDVVMVYSDYLAIDDHGEPLRDPTFRPHNRAPRDAPEIRLPHSTEQLHAIKDNFIGPCFMYRAWVGKVLGPYDVGLLGTEDYDYWLRMTSHFKVAHLGTDEILYKYRVHSNTLNARADELGIHNRVERLMTLDRERRRFYGECFSVFADASLRQELTGVIRCQPLDAYGEAMGSGKRLVLLTASDEAIAWIASHADDKGVFIVLRFDDEAASVHGLEPSLLEKVDLFFVQRDAALRRLRALGKSAFIARTADDLLRLSYVAANEALFREQRDRSEPPAPPPRIYMSVGRRLKVLLQVENFDKGGLEQVVYLLARHLHDKAYEPVIMVLGKVGSLARRARAEGIAVVRPKQSKNAESYVELLQSLAPDIINSHSSWYGLDVIHGLRVPTTQTLHNTYVWFTPAETMRCRVAEAQTDAYICVSRNVMKYSDLRLGLDSGRMRLVPNGIDVERFLLPGEHTRGMRQQIRGAYGFDSRDFVIVCSSAFYRHKGQLEAVLALRQVLARAPHVKLILLGEPVDQKYFGEVSETIARLGCQGSAVMAGFQDDPVGFYYAADCFMLPSYWEGWSLALAEAIAVGLPVIATDVGAARELLSEGALGVLVPPPFSDICDVHWQNWGMYLERGCREDAGFIRALADAMLLASRRPWTEAELRRSTQVVTDKYTATHMAAAYETAYLEVWSAPVITTDQERRLPRRARPLP